MVIGSKVPRGISTVKNHLALVVIFGDFRLFLSTTMALYVEILIFRSTKQPERSLKNIDMILAPYPSLYDFVIMTIHPSVWITYHLVTNLPYSGVCVQEGLTVGAIAHDPTPSLNHITKCLPIWSYREPNCSRPWRCPNIFFYVLSILIQRSCRNPVIKAQQYQSSTIYLQR